MKYFVLFILMFFVPCLAYADNCRTEDPFPYESPYNIEICPEDLQNWMDSLNGCTHFEGELDGVDPVDVDRISFLQGEMNELQCDYIWCEYDDLFAKYEGDIVYTGIITGYAQMIYGDQDVPFCDVEQEMPPEERVGDEYLEDSSVQGKCRVDYTYAYVAPYDMQKCPDDIQDWLERADACASFEGLSMDEDIAAANENLKNQGWVYEDLGCSKIACDFDRLFLKYEGDIVYTGVLLDFEKIMHGENGILQCQAKKTQATPKVVEPTIKDDLKDAGKALKGALGGLFK